MEFLAMAGRMRARAAGAKAKGERGGDWIGALARSPWRSGYGFDAGKRSGGWHARALVAAAFVPTPFALARSIEFVALAS
jgi:hypothetical protein